MKYITVALCLVLLSCDSDTFTLNSNGSADEFAASFTTEDSPITPSAFGSVSTLRHAHLDMVLREHFGPNAGRFIALNQDTEAKQLLGDYKVIVAGIRPEQMSDPSERIAFWLNAYTALVLEGLAKLVERDGDDARIDTDDFALFTQTKHRIAGFDITLEEIEHLVLRGHRLYPDVRDTPVLLADQLMDQHRLLFPTGRRDPRVNFAISFGARSFPPMPVRTFNARTLDSQLDERTRTFINDRDVGASERGVSVLFEWFRRDFVEESGSVRAFIEPYLDDPERQIATDRSLRYDWGIR